MTQPILQHAPEDHSFSTSSVSSPSDASDSNFSWDMNGAMPSGGSGRNDPDAPSVAPEEPTLTPHVKHFHKNGMIDIRVENTLFRVPRLGLETYSEGFALLFKEYDEHVHASDCNVQPLYLQEEDIKNVDFARLLDLVYPSKYGKVELESQDEWLSVLHLATKWSFEDLRALSIERLGSLPTTSAIDKLLMGRKYDVSHWITEAYISLCQRSEVLTLNECQRLSLEDIAQINFVRHEARVYIGLRPLTEIQTAVADVVGPTTAPILTAVERMCATPLPEVDSSNNQAVSITVPPHDTLSDASTLDPPDLPRISRLIKQYSTSPKPVTASALDMLIRPYCNQNTAMESVTELLIEEIPKGATNLTQVGKMLLDMVDPSCGETEKHSDQQPLRGSRWLAQCMVDQCYAKVDHWKDPGISTAGSTIIYLAWLNETDCLSRDVFEPLWLELIRQVQGPQSSWNLSLPSLLRFASVIQTSANALHVDQFFDQMQRAVEGRRRCGSLPDACHYNYHAICQHCCLPGQLLPYKP